MTDKQVHLTENEAIQIAKNIEDIAKNIEESSKRLDTTTETLINGASGAEIDGLKVYGKKLIDCIGTLAISALDVGSKIGEFIVAIVREDEEAARKIKESMN